MKSKETNSVILDQAVAEGGAYEVLHKRLLEQGQRLSGITRALNERRLQEFGASPQEVIGRVRIHTGNNCVARDIVRVGADLLFGYNVFIGLRKETRVEDVFSLYRLVDGEGGYEAEPRSLEDSFLADATFVRDFRELYAYYKNTRLLQLAVRNGRLLASFQIGERVGDIRVFRWSISDDEREVRYIDNRGERDIALPAVFANRLGYPHQAAQAVAMFVVAGFLFVAFKCFVFRHPVVEPRS